ncbi:hypothetical protein [Streptomyces sp. NPDC096152]|uniref:hypothetical protein n=1 Tax=Streptomyces sp. NPDC096152 TaxID=3366078 RepID=UPI00381A1A2D
MNLRLLALLGVVTGAVVLPFAVASAGPVDSGGRAVAPSAPRSLSHGDDKMPRGDHRMPSGDDGAPSKAPAASPLLLGLGLATAARCGPEVTSPEGVEAQTCVLTQGEDTWARAYYRNATGKALDAALSLLAPGDRTVQTHCALDGSDEPGTCETPREHTRGTPAAYSAVAEFAAPGGRGPMLLRSGSNSSADTGG